MQTRAVRLTLLVLLLVCGAGAGFFTWDTLQRLDLVLAAERDIDARLDRLANHVIAFGAAQQASVVPGQAQGEALTRGSALVRAIDEDLAAVRPRARSVAAVTAFSAFADTLEAAVKTDIRVREHLRIGQELMAADLVFEEGRQSIDALAAIVGDLQRAEEAASDDERRELRTRNATVLGAVTLLWVIGLCVLARQGADRSVAPRQQGTAEHGSEASVEASRASSGPREPQPVNMAEAAAVCTALSRVVTGAEIPRLLARAAHVLDASGIIVWLGAGEDLFAATSHGYHPRVLARLGPIRRNAENATADAWRACALRVVAGDSTHNGAVVVPLFGPSAHGTRPDGCIGVVTVEVPGGREHDGTIQGVAAMIAAQLATLVTAWPAASAVEGPAPSARGDAANERRESTTRDAPSEAADADPKVATA
jgi:hypothetical protein